jgi:hypothetical protein
MKKAKVRFNLGRGKNYLKWKIEHSEGVVYLSPDEFNLKMTNARLRNRRSTANKIKDGANKSVCSWILCDECEVLSHPNPWHATSDSKQVRYNPRINPFWMDENENNIDGTSYDVLYTNGRKIYK